MTALRPVYIDRGASAVRLDGPALIVEQKELAEGRFRLRLVSRVVVRGQVPWSMDALLACLAGGIPVTFLSMEGEVVGLCLGRDRPEESLIVLLDRLTGEPGWAEIWERWRLAAERRAIVEVGRRLALPIGTDLRPDGVRRLLAVRLPGGDTPGARSTMRRRCGFLMRPSRGALHARRRAGLLSRRPQFGARFAARVPCRIALVPVDPARALARIAAAASRSLCR